jgi:hypothetical protein
VSTIVPSFHLAESVLSGVPTRSVSGLDLTVWEPIITTIRLRMAHPEPFRRWAVTQFACRVNGLTELLVPSSTNITAMSPITQ